MGGAGVGGAGAGGAGVGGAGDPQRFSQQSIGMVRLVAVFVPPPQIIVEIIFLTMVNVVCLKIRRECGPAIRMSRLVQQVGGHSVQVDKPSTSQLGMRVRAGARLLPLHCFPPPPTFSSKNIVVVTVVT